LALAGLSTTHECANLLKSEHCVVRIQFTHIQYTRATSHPVAQPLGVTLCPLTLPLRDPTTAEFAIVLDGSHVGWCKLGYRSLYMTDVNSYPALGIFDCQPFRRSRRHGLALQCEPHRELGRLCHSDLGGAIRDKLSVGASAVQRVVESVTVTR
jgi:hypothetical protein